MLMHSSNKGFALPTVIISSIVMLIVLLSGLTAVSSVNTALRQQYYDRLTKEAVESGVTMADMCLAKSSQVVTWDKDGQHPLMPNTDCNGYVITTPPAPSQYILNTQNLKTTFSVPAAIDQNGALRVNVTATLYKYRTSGAGTPQSQVESRSSLVGGQNTFSNVAFGYASAGGFGTSAGAQFALVLASGEVKVVGRNNNGRLGNGTTVDALSPSTFILPGSEKGASAYSNFLSVGVNMAVITTSGNVYGAGNNDYGQLGQTGLVTPYESTPRKFGLPAGVQGRFIALNNYANFVIGSDYNIYAAGSCTNGFLGTGSSCATTSTPTRVALPTVNTGNPNTLPVLEPGWVQPTNLTTDRLNAYVRMQGGDVYGWGINDFGQLGNGGATASSTPVKIGAPTVSNPPVATQIAFNGTALYILDTNGLVWAVGANTQGQQLGAGGVIRNVGNTSACLRKDPSSNNVLTAGCSSADGWEYLEWWPDGTWRFRTNSYTSLPTDSMLCATAPGALGANIQMLPCTGGANQQWTYRDDKTIYSAYLNACVEPYGTIYLAGCSGSTYQQWQLLDSPYLRPVPTPPGNPKAIRITTDNANASILYDDGSAWGAGSNYRGQLGNGTVGRLINPALSRAQLPGGLKAVDFYTTETLPYASTMGSGNESAYNDNYYVMSDGSVYGAGANNFGQLGNGTTGDYAATPVKMNLPAGAWARTVQSGFGTTIVLTSGGKVYTVGNNSNGQLGDGTTTNSSTPKANTYTNQRTTIRY